MSVDQATGLIKSLADLLGVLVWPTLTFFLLVRYRAPLRDFLNSLSELSIKGGGVEATAKRRVEVAVALGSAVATRPEAPAKTAFDLDEETRQVAKLIADHVTPRTVRKAEGTRILWVDDRPENNVFERRSLEALGIQFDLSRSTDDALRRLTTTHYDAVISDMGRPPDRRAGYTLLDSMRQRGNRIPTIIYARSKEPEQVEEAKRHGAVGTTNRAEELFELVLSVVGT
jgi:CheY-like chemotaxis protein